MKKCRYDIDRFIQEMCVETGDIAVLFLSFIDEMASEVSAMHACLRERNWEMLQRVVHNIKGVSANLYIKDVYDFACAFDAKLKQGMVDDAQVQVDKLEQLLAGAEEEIKRYFTRKGYSL